MNMPKIKYYLNFIILRRNFWLLAIISFLSYHWYTEFSSLAGDSAKIQIVLSGVTIFFCAAVFLFSLCTSLPPYLSLWFKKRVLETEDAEKHDVIKVRFKESNPTPGLVEADIRIYGVSKPLLGFAKTKVVFDDYLQTDEVLLDKVIRRQGKKAGIMARKGLLLPNIKDYRILSSIVQFEDFFHLFSWPYREHEDNGVFTEPPQRDGEEIPIHTSKSEDPVMKVIQHKVAKGELLDYKKYAPGDDIRRIIWKNYARNRELTVRTFDRTFPYVSHINVLVSFYDGSPGKQPIALKDHLLDIYKEKIRQVMDSIMDQGFSVRLILDQDITHHYDLDEYEMMLYQVSASRWQTEQPPEAFMRENAHRMRNGSNLLVFSSLCPMTDLEVLQNGRATDLNMCCYNVRHTFDNSQPPSVLKRLFFVDAYDPLEAARREQNARSTVKFIHSNGDEIQTAFNSKFNETVIQI